MMNTESTMKVKKVPPDGGYGWVIVFAVALSNIVVIPLMQGFGLIFKDTFDNLGLSATQASLIINLNSAFGMIAGLLNGVLLKVFGYRKIAIAGAVMVSVGVILTAFSTTFVHFMVSYGVITSLGIAWGMSAYQLALNSYFTKNRGRAVSWASTITGLGPIILPQVISFLMSEYSVQGVTLILSSICSHSFIAAMLLQPVEWHMKREIPDVEKVNEFDKIDEEEEEEEPVEGLKNGNGNGKEDVVFKPRIVRSISQVEEPRNLKLRRNTNERYGSQLSLNHEQDSVIMLGMDSAFAGSMISVHSVNKPLRRPSVISQRFKSNTSLNNQKASQTIYNPEMSKPKEEKSLLRRIGATLSSYFDLDLLKDPIYVNIMLGMSFAIFAELNFSVLTAFILADIGLSREQSATFMSILGISDIIFRFCAPYIGEYLNKPARPMYMITLFMLIITRFSLLLTSNYYMLMCVALGLGIAKGVRTVYMALVIPTYVPLEKLASASGIQMMVNGCFFMIGGPLLGVIRDLTGSYTSCIVIMNCVTLTTIIMWTVEALIVKMKKKKLEPEQVTEQQSALLKK